MDLKQALEIMKDQYEELMALQGREATEDITKEASGYDVESMLWSGFDPEYLTRREASGKGVVTEENQTGGEGEGEYYHIVFKVAHPELGVAYLKYQGSYDSWSGTTWDYFDNPQLCVPKEKTITVYENV